MDMKNEDHYLVVVDDQFGLTALGVVNHIE
jgi:hypothetical protein